jgi:hypothetical protein
MCSAHLTRSDWSFLLVFILVSPFNEAETFPQVLITKPGLF